MIVRQAIIRHGRRLVATSPRFWTRCMATEVETLESSIENALKQTHSIESQLQDCTSRPIPQASDATHVSQSPWDQTAVIRHRSLVHQAKSTAHHGTVIAPHYNPNDLITNPPSPSEVTLELLLASQAHLGHATSLWNPGNSRYIFGIRQGIHIIGLEHTASHLRRACRVVSGVAKRAGIILFVGTRPGQERAVVAAAKRAGRTGCHLFTKWTPGTVTNRDQILGACEAKPVDELDREIAGWEEEIRDRLPPLKPDLVVCLNPLENWVMLKECGLHSIPTVGIVDTDANPTWVTYPIPANDDSLRCTQLLCGVLSKAAEEGNAERLKEAARGKLTYKPFDLEPLRFNDEIGDERGTKVKEEVQVKA